MKPLGQSRDSTTPENSVVCGLSQEIGVQSQKTSFSIHHFLSWGWGSDEEKQRGSVAWAGTAGWG